MVARQEAPAEILGTLAPLYEEYRSTVAGASDEPKIVYYYEAIQLDKIANARKALSIDASEEEKLAQIEKAKHYEISGKQAALSSAGFVGTAAKLFEEYVDFRANEETPSEGFLRSVAILQMVPPEQQRGANVSSVGYYYGGIFNRISDDVIRHAMGHVES